MKTIVMMAVLAAFSSWQAFGLATADSLGIPLTAAEEVSWQGAGPFSGRKCDILQRHCETTVQIGGTCSPGTPDYYACSQGRDSKACNYYGWLYNECVGDVNNTCPTGVAVRCDPTAGGGGVWNQIHGRGPVSCGVFRNCI